MVVLMTLFKWLDLKLRRAPLGRLAGTVRHLPLAVVVQVDDLLGCLADATVNSGPHNHEARMTHPRFMAKHYCIRRGVPDEALWLRLVAVVVIDARGSVGVDIEGSIRADGGKGERRVASKGVADL